MNNSFVSTFLRQSKESSSKSWKNQISDPEKRKTAYAESTVPTTVHPDIIFYESMSGARLMDSPYAIFSEIRNRNRAFYKKTLHVWSIGKSFEVSPELSSDENVVFVQRHTPEYIYYLSRAKFVIGNSILPEYFVRREGQKYLNTWHGIGYKSLGRTPANPLGAALSVSNMLQATHVLSPCRFMTDIQLDGFSMRGVYAGEFLESGYPRIDLTVNTSSSRAGQLKVELGLNPDLPIILYAPTWRGDNDDDAFDEVRLKADLRLISTDEVNVIFLGHHIMLRKLRGIKLNNVVIPPENSNTNELLSITDILITDYSSIFFDFLVTRKPIVHYIYDVEQYTRARGVSLEVEELPGFVAQTSEQLQESVLKAMTMKEDFSSKYEAARQRFCPHDDGQSSAIVVSWFFDNQRPGRSLVDSHAAKRNKIYWGGRLGSEQSTKDYFDLILQDVAKNEVNVILFVARSVRKNSLAMKLIGQLGNSIAVITRSDYNMGMTADEYRARQTLASDSLPETRSNYYAIYAREYKRIFGSSTFDEICMFPESSRFWKELSKYALK